MPVKYLRTIDIQRQYKLDVSRYISLVEEEEGSQKDREILLADFEWTFEWTLSSIQ